MKTIGVLGGLGPESTTDYYKEIISVFNKNYPHLPYPEIIIYSTDIKQLMEFVKNSHWNGLTQWLLQKITSIHNAGADFAAIASNTPHIVFDQLKKLSPVPLISIVEQTSKTALDMGLKNIGLMGTKLTMTSDFYKAPFIKKNMSVFVPSEKEQDLIHHRLFSEIELGIIKDTTRSELLEIVKQMIKRHKIDSLILGCTELPLILTKSEFNIPFLNTASIHCKSIIDYCLND